MIFNVEQIVLKFLPCIFDRCAVGILDLGPTREPRRDQMSLLVKRDLLRELSYEMRALGPWPNEAHLTLQDVPELWDLIHADLAYYPADASGARVALAG